MTTVTFSGIVPPDELKARRELERERREATKCPDLKCRQYKPNHLWGCSAVTGSGPDAA